MVFYKMNYSKPSESFRDIVTKRERPQKKSPKAMYDQTLPAAGSARKSAR